MVKSIACARDKRVDIISTIDPVKEIATNIGWDGKKDVKSRKFLSDLKDALTEWKDLPHQWCITKIEELSYNTDLLFIDCREPQEIQRFVDEYGALTMIVQRGEYTPIGNHADDNVDNYQYDIVIDNNRGLEELLQEATIFVETFIMEEE